MKIRTLTLGNVLQLSKSKFKAEQSVEIRASRIKDNKTNNLTQKYAQIFVIGHCLFLKANSFLNLHSWKTVPFTEQIMPANKHLNILRQMDPTVFRC